MIADGYLVFGGTEKRCEAHGLAPLASHVSRDGANLHLVAGAGYQIGQFVRVIADADEIIEAGKNSKKK